MNVDIYDQLKEFGIDRKLAEEAAKRYGSMEAAVDWCFGPGANVGPPFLSSPAHRLRRADRQWTPDEALPSYDSLHKSGAQTEHRENASSQSPPPLPPRSPRPASTAFSSLAESSSSFASNNPFNNNPPPPDQATLDDHDQDLQRAIQMSQQHISGSVTPASESEEEEIRMQRERSVRATAPPPSPSPEDTPPIAPLFGPSERTEDGSTALVSLPDPEDEDLNRAIQDSLMTASFHSASAFQAMDKPQPMARPSGAPLALLSQSGDMTFAALYLQAMMAVPQIREVFKEAPIASLAFETARSLQGSLQTLEARFENEQDSFIEVDELLRDLTYLSYRTSQLPPERPTRDLLEKFEYQITNNWLEWLKEDPELQDSRPRGGRWDKPDLLFKSVIYQPYQVASFVTFRRSARLPNNLYAHLSDILWGNDSVPSSVQRLAEVLAVFIAWDPNPKREVWKLEERVVLDRFMKDEELWATQIRAEQSVASGNARRLKEHIEKLTFYNGTNFQQSIAELIKHYESSSASDDPIHSGTQEEMKAKLSKILSMLQNKVKDLQVELDAEMEKSNGELFHTEDPERNKHVYLLRAVLFHDGSMVGPRHLYGYFRNEEGHWWKVQDHEISQVDWKDVENDSTGIYIEGGPYQLIYSRDGPAIDSLSSTPTTTDSSMEGVQDTTVRSEPVQEVQASGESEQDLINLDESTPEPPKSPVNTDAKGDEKSDDLIVLD